LTGVVLFGQHDPVSEDEDRRHQNVLLEDMGKNLKLMAEAHTALREGQIGLAQHLGRVETKVDGLDLRLSRVETDVAAIKDRVGHVETDVAAIKVRVGKIEHHIGPNGTSPRRPAPRRKPSKK
jgi:hypothetical protein